MGAGLGGGDLVASFQASGGTNLTLASKALGSPSESVCACACLHLSACAPKCVLPSVLKDVSGTTRAGKKWTRSRMGRR